MQIFFYLKALNETEGGTLFFQSHRLYLEHLVKYNIWFKWLRKIDLFSTFVVLQLGFYFSVPAVVSGRLWGQQPVLSRVVDHVEERVSTLSHPFLASHLRCCKFISSGVSQRTAWSNGSQSQSKWPKAIVVLFMLPSNDWRNDRQGMFVKLKSTKFGKSFPSKLNKRFSS